MSDNNESKELATIDEETTAIAPLRIMNFTEKQIDLIKSTIAKDATDDELKLFLYQAQKTGLDPLANQCYMIKRWDSSQNKMVGTIQTGIDGFRLVAQRSGAWAGTSEVTYAYREDDLEKKIPFKAKVTVYRLMNGERVGISHTVFWDEYVQKKKDGTPTKFWRDMPHGQLGKCAEAGALRKAFPHDLSGLYTNDEMAQAKNTAPEDAKKSTAKKKAITPPDPIEKLTQDLRAVCKETNQPKEVMNFLGTIKQSYPRYWNEEFLKRVIKEIKDNGGSAWDVPEDPEKFFNQFSS